MKAKRVDSWPFQILGGEAVIVVPQRREIHRLNEVGTFLWNELREERGIEELAARVSEEFEVDEAAARADVERFIEDLRKRGLVS
ncbi:MAG: PqqD family protein [Planctomycetes bacterium]|nr:PqqD family protein [Planctomycetota bacterium]